MIKIIETNLMLDDKLNNFQSRVIEVESWEYVIEQFTSEDIKHPETHYDIYGRYSGTIVPRFAQIENLEYDENRLTCDVVIFNGRRTKKLIERY